ncbi:hypothetical protein GCM10027515_26640 [Schumannella luteola]|uniref:Uncharacterized protein n=1 Tax=Schumannella luteola TaxID=472059 RepID=A0A852YP79_9MICO|nr:hypothetical protein [Schumannella luteola]NYG99539.1 hypothetical protein [Schumannella luteola]TPX03856.1 hypothetical protein FJ656_15100 [Schumannella luteola]
MEFWSDIGDFFATFEPKDWVTSALALLAILVALFTASQTWRYHPRPLIMIDRALLLPAVEPDGYGNDAGPRIEVDVVNRGNAAAHAVRIVTKAKGRRKESFERPILEPGATWRIEFTLADKIRSPDPDEPRRQIARWSRDSVPKREVRVWRRWRQSPLMRFNRFWPVFVRVGRNA